MPDTDTGMVVVVQHTNVAGIAITNKSCLIMDEVDGMSAGDRGGVGALVALIKKTKVHLPYGIRAVYSFRVVKIPIICIANDRNAQKLKPLVNNTFNLSYRRYATNCSACLNCLMIY